MLLSHRPRKLVGDERITLLRPRAAPPEGFTGLAWHKRRDMAGAAHAVH